MEYRNNLRTVLGIEFQIYSKHGLTLFWGVGGRESFIH